MPCSTDGAEGLPRLLYVGDVPIEASMHGSALLYRLLETYPSKDLLIAEGLTTSDAEKRIRGIKYIQYRPFWCRPVLTRFHRWATAAATAFAPLGGRGIASIAREFRPQAVLTVVDGYVWQAAATYAEMSGVPLHLIVHDDWPNVGDAFHGGPTSDFFMLEHRLKDIHLRRWYPIASSRLCVSPAMEKEYHKRYGMWGDVLYPSRSLNGPVFCDPPDILRDAYEPFSIVFAGTVYPEYARSLRRLAIALQQSSGRLIVFGKLEGAAHNSLQEPNIEFRGVVNSSSLIQQCRQEGHAVFVPMSYREEDRANVELSFPSKLADLTAVGLPLIIDGPEYCSAVRWAKEHRGMCEVITEETVAGLVRCIERLLVPAYRMQLARRSIMAGKECFDADGAISLFHRKLREGMAVRDRRTTEKQRFENARLIG